MRIRSSWQTPSGLAKANSATAKQKRRLRRVDIRADAVTGKHRSECDETTIPRHSVNEAIALPFLPTRQRRPTICWASTPAPQSPNSISLKASTAPSSCVARTTKLTPAADLSPSPRRQDTLRASSAFARSSTEFDHLNFAARSRPSSISLPRDARDSTSPRKEEATE